MLLPVGDLQIFNMGGWWVTPPTSILKTIPNIVSPLKYLNTEVVWSGGVFSAAQMLLNNHTNIIGIL